MKKILSIILCCAVLLTSVSIGFVSNAAPNANVLVQTIVSAIAVDLTGLDFDELLQLYGNVVRAYHGLTGNIAGEPNFPSFTWAMHGVSPAAPGELLRAIRAAVQHADIRLLLDYSQAPAGTNWTLTPNFEPGQAEHAELLAFGGPLSDIERDFLQNLSDPPEIDENAVPDITLFPRGSAEPDVTLEPSAHAIWLATNEMYDWLDTLGAFPFVVVTDQEKLNYIENVALRAHLEGVYEQALNNALREPRLAFNHLQTQWMRFQGDPNNRQNFINAVQRYFAMRGTDGFALPNGYTDMREQQRVAVLEMHRIGRRDTFFNAFRLGLSAENFVRYNNDQLRREHADILQAIREFAAGEEYLTTLHQAMRNRVFDGIDDLDIYNFDNLALLRHLDSFSPNAAELTLLNAARAEHNRRQALAHERLHEDLLAGRVAPWFDNWLPRRGLQNPIALEMGFDEYQVTYDDVLHTIDQLDVLFNSVWFFELMTGIEHSEATELHRRWPNIELPELNMSFLSRLGEMTVDRDSFRADDPAFGTPMRQHIVADRGHVFLYLLHEMLDQQVGLDFIAWLTQELITSEDIDLTPAAEPFFVTYIAELLQENLLDHALPHAIISLQDALVDTLMPMLHEPLLRRPGDVTGRGLMEDVQFAQLHSGFTNHLEISLTLSYMLEQITERSAWGITLGDILHDERLQDMLGLMDLDWLQVLLGIHPITLDSLAGIDDPQERITQSMVGMAPLLRAMFADTALDSEHVQGHQDDEWAMDLVVGLEDVTPSIVLSVTNALGGIIDFIGNAAVGVANAGIRLINRIGRIFGANEIEPLPDFEFWAILPDLSLRDQAANIDVIRHLPVQWNGVYDSFAGIAARLPALNAYGNVILPLFELLGMDDFIAYNEDEFNAAMRNAADDEAVAQLLTRAIFTPLFDWLPTMGTLPALLDLLPNVALASMQLEDAVADMLGDMQSNVTLHFAGATGEALAPLELVLANFLQDDWLSPFFFFVVFTEVLPTLISAPPGLSWLTEGEHTIALFTAPLEAIRDLSDPDRPENFTGIFRNRVSEDGEICNHVSLLEGRGEPAPGISRDATLGSIAGFFGADRTALDELHPTFNLPLGPALNTHLPLIDHFSEAIFSLLEQPASDFTPAEPMQNLLASMSANSTHSIAWLVEFFNPQAYPARGFMRYTWVQRAATPPTNMVNPVEYSRVWTRRCAERLMARLPSVLDNLTNFIFEQDFATWFDLPDLDREELIAQALTQLEPYMPLLRASLLAENLPLLGGLTHLTGYDGYLHGIIPILEAFGVPQEEILPFDEFVQLADTDEQFIRLLVDPLLDVLERVLADPIHELPRVLPNIIYFIAAEEPGRPSNLVTALNRVFRPIYAAVDMLAPMADMTDIFALFGMEYPMVIEIGGIVQELRLPIEPALDAIFAGLIRQWFGELAQDLNLVLALVNLTELLTGELSLFTSMNGQDDAVRLDSDLPDLITHWARLLIPLILSPENWSEMRLVIAARLPANTRGAVLWVLDGLADLLRDTRSVDVVLLTMTFMLTGADWALEGLLALRQFRRQIEAFFNYLAGYAEPFFWGMAIGALGALATIGTVGFFTVLAHNVRHNRQTEQDVLAAYVPIPQTGDSRVVAIIAALIGSLAVAGALLMMKKPERLNA